MQRNDNLIMDVGMHDGEDTARFLTAGFRVVAVEADPALAAEASEKFSQQIRDGRLTVVHAAIAEGRGTARFGIADATIWSSLEPEMISRNERLGAKYEYVDVPTLPFADVLAEHGVPYYLKIDIEGYDMLCVRALHSFEEKPAFLSIESNVTTLRARGDAVFDELAQLWTLGYRRFRYVDQARIANEAPRRGEWAGPSWRSAWAALAQAQVLRAHQNFAGMGGRFSRTAPAKAYNFARRNLSRPMAWYDLHAALPSDLGLGSAMNRRMQLPQCSSTSG